MTTKEKLVNRILDLSIAMPSREKFAHYLMQCTDQALLDRLDTMEKDSDRRGAYLITRRRRTLPAL